MKKLLHITGLALMFGMLIILSNSALSFEGSNSEGAEIAPEKGPHNGRLLKDGDFVLELSIFETGVPPEFRVWVSNKGEKLKPTDVDLKITLTRLGGVEDKINFTPQGDFLRGDMVIYEPHSFVVSINANYQGQLHHWQYDNL
ncbi:MAG: secretion protein HlyD, partial [Cycloclasticus sp.]|nr:secretion protein HlyD [Cycloclasticus sp.]